MVPADILAEPKGEHRQNRLDDRHRSRTVSVSECTAATMFHDSRNERARAFCEARGFQLEKKFNGFFWWDDALLYVRILASSESAEPVA